jgi:ABC-2 type transport system ATP-binding protein
MIDGMTQAIAFDEVTKRFGPVVAVDRVSFDVHTGEVVGFLGPNGAGKTTTMRMVLDAIRPSAGRVRVFGEDPRRGGPRLRRRIGYVPGDLTLYNHMTGRHLLQFFGSLRGDDTADLAANALAQRLHVDLDKPIGTLSRGNRQKVGILQAFVHDPELLLLDEPTTGLDPLAQREVRAMMREATARGAAVFLSSHVLSEVQRVADRVAIIRAGRLVTIEPIHELETQALRVVEIRFSGPVPTDAFAHLPGVQHVDIEGDLLRASVVGPVDALVKAAARYTVESIAGHEAELEDVFLSYYGRAGDAAA